MARRAGKIVVAGGYGPTFSPEAFDRADMLVRGEFEPTAGEVLESLCSERRGLVYDSRRMDPFDLTNYVRPDRSIFPRPRPLERRPQEWQRGCTGYCSICSPTRMQRGGGEVRYRSVGNIIEEIEQMGLRPGDHLFATDLNTSVIPREVLYELFGYLRQNGICWYTEGTVAPLIEDWEKFGPRESLLGLMVTKEGRGGCYSFLYGPDDLTGNKVSGSRGKDLGVLEKATTIFRKLGIPLNLSVVIGLDNHVFPDTFYEYAFQLLSLRVPYTFVHLATPYPGTPWGDGIKRAGRIVDTESLHYNHQRPVFEPKNMTKEQLQQGYFWLGKVLNTPREIVKVIGRNFNPERVISLPLLETINSGLPWRLLHGLSYLELKARGFIDKQVQGDLDLGYRAWLSGTC